MADRKADVDRGLPEPGTSLLQLTNEVYPGNSGGAALNSRGELLGLVQGELGAPEAPGQRERGERRPGGLSFAIPVEDIVPFLDGVAKYGRVRHGMLGVSTRGAFVNGISDPTERVPIGALVEAVQPAGAAARATGVAPHAARTIATRHGTNPM